MKHLGILNEACVMKNLLFNCLQIYQQTLCASAQSDNKIDIDFTKKLF